MTLSAVALRNLGRSPLRTTLTITGIAVSMLAFLILRTVLAAWTAGAQHASHDRIATRHRISFALSLPVRYAEEMRRVAGIQDVSYFEWFGGRLPDRKNAYFANIAVDPEPFLRVFDEIQVDPNQREAWIKNRRGALIGAQLASKFGWALGDRVTLQGSKFRGDWEFTIEGIYTTKRTSLDQSTFFFNWRYINESSALLPQLKDRVGGFISRVDDPTASARIASEVDRMFGSRDVQTLSMSERAMNVSLLGMLSALLGAITLISIVLLAIMMLLLGNTIAMAVRDRTQEYGVLRALGFAPAQLTGLVLCEGMAIGVGGGLLGLLLAHPLINRGMGPFMVSNFGAFFPHFSLGYSDAVIALAIVTASAVLAALIPAYRAGTLNVIDALRQTA